MDIIVSRPRRRGGKNQKKPRRHHRSASVLAKRSRYRLTNRRMRNKLRKQRRHFKKHPKDKTSCYFTRGQFLEYLKQ